MTIFDQNRFNIEARISQGLELIKKHYELKEIDSNEFKKLHIQEMDYTVKQYEIKGVGNLLVMACKESKVLQMDSIVITPYYKNLPMFSTDYLYMKEKRSFLNELYSLVEKEDELYNKYMADFKKLKQTYDYLPDMSLKACWYDEMRPSCVAKHTEVAEDEEIIKLYMKHLELFIKMEKEMPVLNEKQYEVKWQKTQDYTNRLVDQGGVSTDVFKAVLGEQQTKTFFNRVFFAPSLYKK